MAKDPKEILNAALYSERSVAETQAIYADWAQTYDADVAASGYVTPDRIAAALRGLCPPDASILDFGCGTGLSGVALASAGFTAVDGCDISAEMLELAQPRGVYRALKLAEIDTIPFATGTHSAVTAMGVVSAGAAPPGTLRLLVDHLPKGGFLAFSFNDPTLKMGTYDAVLDDLVEAGHVTVLSRDHGPHLPAKGMGSDVIVIRKS